MIFLYRFAVSTSRNERNRSLDFSFLTPTLSAWLLRSHWTLKSILQETLFLDQLHDFFVFIVKFIFTAFFEIKNHVKKFLGTKKISFSKPDSYKPIHIQL